MNAFSIVFVCTGNRFRSPLAEGFVRTLTEGLPVRTQSFGTLELGSVPALREAVAIGSACGVPISDHRTRHLGVESLEDVDLVVGFEHAHVRQAVVDAKAPRDRSFTLREFVRLAEEDDAVDESVDVVSRARAVVKRASQRRGATGPRAADDMRDPFGQPWSAYRGSAEEIRALSIALVETLFGVSTLPELPGVPSRRRRSWMPFGRR